MDFKKTKAILLKGALFTAVATAGLVGSAGATFNMTLSFQPIIDMIGVLTTNSDSWISLVVLGVEITIALAVGYFVRGIMTKATGGGGHGK